VELTELTESAIVRRVRTVAGVVVVLLHAFPAIVTVHPEVVAVALTARLDPRRDPGPVLEVKGHTVEPQGADAAQEPPLAP